MEPGLWTGSFGPSLQLGICADIASCLSTHGMRRGFPHLWPVLLALLSLPAWGRATDDFFDRALERQKAGDLAGAIVDYTQALALDPKNAQAYNNRGEARRHRGDVAGAIADFTRALELDPKHANTYYNRGIARKQQGDLEGAIADYTWALKLNPKFTPAYNNRGFARKQLGDLAGAIADYTQVIKIDPKHAIACNNRGIARYLNRNWAEALVDFRRRAELAPEEADTPQLYVWILQVRLGDSTSADRELAAYLLSRAGPTNIAWARRVGAFLLNHVSEAALLQAAASTDHELERGQLCSGWFFSGMKLLLVGERLAAAEHFQKCLATERKNDPEYEFAAAELKALQ